MSRCQIKTVMKDGHLIIDLSGHIDENFLQAVQAVPESKSYIFNLRALTSINSSGIREWIKYAQKIKNSQVILVECPKPFIDQASMVEGFLPSTFRVASFYVPYYCEDADEEKLVLYQFGKDYTAEAINIPNEIKDEKGQAFEIDIVPSKYFKFLKG